MQKLANMVLARQKRDKETELATQEAKSNAAQAKVEESKDKLKRANSSISTLQKDIAQKKDYLKKAKTAADASIAALKKSESEKNQLRKQLNKTEETNTSPDFQNKFEQRTRIL